MYKNVDSDLANLMDLLDEQDVSLFEEISESIISYGPAAIPYLEAASDKTLDETVHSRIKFLLKEIRIHSLYSELHNWATLESHDLLKGYFIVSKYQFPLLEEEVVMAKLEALKKEVWLELKKDMTPFEEAKVISKVFFEVRKYTLNQNKESMPDCVCLNAVLNSGKGYPDAFSMLYAGIAQRLGIPIYGLKLPDVMFLAYVCSDGKQKLDLRNDVKFYINPFAAGVFFPVKDIDEHLVQTYPDDYEKYSGACSNIEFIGKILITITDHYIRKNRPDKVADLLLLMTALNVD